MINFTDEDEIQSAFVYYRENGFPYPKYTHFDIIHIFRKIQNSKAKINKTKRNLFGSRIKTIEVQPIGDIRLPTYFHPHIWQSHAIGMRSSVQSFNIDKSLRKVMRLCLKHTGEINDESVQTFIRLVNGTQICSNFRPSAAKAIYDYFKPSGDVLDMSAGYGGRLIGFLASNCKGNYIGVDPSRKSCIGNKKITKEFNVKRRVTIICSPFEDVENKSLSKVDLAFTSTPYFLKETYEENNPKQSCERYPTYREWLNGFLKSMIIKTREVLNSNGIMALNIADVKIKGKLYPLVKSTIRIAKQNGFVLTERLELKFFGFGKGLDKQKTEPVLIFEKAK